jgi:hypothetical protein
MHLSCRIITILLEFQCIVRYTPTNRMAVFRPEIMPTDSPTCNSNAVRFSAQRNVPFTRY